MKSKLKKKHQNIKLIIYLSTFLKITIIENNYNNNYKFFLDLFIFK